MRALLQALNKDGQQHITQASTLLQEVVVPVMEYIEAYDANRKALLAQERAASGEMASARYALDAPHCIAWHATARHHLTLSLVACV